MKVCTTPGCPVLVEKGYCPTHAAEKRYQHRRFTQLRVAAGNDYYPPVHYGRRWQRAAKAYLSSHPYCVDCQAEGHSHGLATEVDHNEPHRGDPVLFWDPMNWRARCKPHHSQKTAREVGWGG